MKNTPRRYTVKVHPISISPSELTPVQQAEIAELLDYYRDDLAHAWHHMQSLPQCSKLLAPLIGKAEDYLAQAVYILKHEKQITYEKK